MPDRLVRFAPGLFQCQTFEWDTDFGPGTTGGSIAGAVITVTLDSGQVLTGTLAVDPNDTNRSFVVLF